MNEFLIEERFFLMHFPSFSFTSSCNLACGFLLQFSVLWFSMDSVPNMSEVNIFSLDSVENFGEIVRFKKLWENGKFRTVCVKLKQLNLVNLSY